MPQPGTTTERRLGTWPIFVIAVSAMTPLTVVAGALPLGYGEVEEKGIPVAYMLVAAVLGVFAVGLAAMARHVPNRGAFYAYAAAGLSRPAGVGTAFVALLAYNAMQIGLYGAFGVAAHHVMAEFGADISWIVWALLGWALIAVLGRLNIDLNARILTVLVCAEVLIVLILDAAMLANPAGGTVTFDTLNPALIATAGGVALLVAAVAGMVGFEAPLVYAAEAKDPRRTVARAIGLTLLVAAVLYGGTAWVMSVVAGPDQIIVVASEHLSDLFFYLPEPYLPAVIIDLARVFFATSLFAAMLAFHHTVARYALTVAREGVLPGSLARTRDDVPITASLAQSGLALGVLLIFALATWNPTTDLFFFGTVSGGLGVLILMAIAAVAVVRYFRADDHGETRWRRSIAPWTAVVFLVVILLLTVASFGILLDSDNLLKVWSPPLAFLLLFLLGVYWGRRLRRERPEVYAGIGSGLPPSAPAGAAARPQADPDATPRAAAAEPRRDAEDSGVESAAGTGPARANEQTPETSDAAQDVSGPASEQDAKGVSGPASAPADKQAAGAAGAAQGASGPSPAPAADKGVADTAGAGVGQAEASAADAAVRSASAPAGEATPDQAGTSTARTGAPGEAAPDQADTSTARTGAPGEDEPGSPTTGPAPGQRTSHPRKRTSRRGARPAGSSSEVPGEATEPTPPNGAIRRPRAPRSPRAPGRGSAEPLSDKSPGTSRPSVSTEGSPSVQVSGTAQISSLPTPPSPTTAEAGVEPQVAPEPGAGHEASGAAPAAEGTRRTPQPRKADPDSSEDTP